MSPRIVYLTYPATEVAGGIKIAFRHVESLRAAGFDAATASHGAKKPGWFETSAPILDLDTQLPDDDILVFPENNYGFLRQYSSRLNRKLVFCQNQYYVLSGLGGPGGQRDYADFGVTGIMSSSRSVAEFCRLRFPKMPSALVPVGINQSLFTAIGKKKLQIAFVPRKRQMEAGFIWDLFRAKNPEYADVPWRVLHSMPERQVAVILSESAVSLALCRYESLGMTILESMLSGCVTAGFTGFGAREFTTAQNGFWAEEDDCIQCADLLGRAVRLAATGGPDYTKMLGAARESAAYYSNQMMNTGVVAFWKNYLAGTAFTES